jgi:superfamily II DNA or RNA helicase
MTSTSADEAIAAAKAKVGRGARAVIDDVRAFVDDGVALLDAGEALRREAAALAADLTAGEVDARLRELPVSALADIVGPTVPLQNLAASGYPTVAHVRASPSWLLQQVPGVGEESAERLGEAAAGLAQRVRREIRLRLDPDRRPLGHTRLLTMLAALRQADDAVAALRRPLDQFAAGVMPLLAEAELATGPVRLRLARRAARDAALSALARLEAIMADRRVSALRQEVELRAAASDPGEHRPEQVWRDYLADAATVNALLSVVSGGARPDEREAAQGFVATELRQRISAVPLDTDLLTVTLRGYQVFGAQYAIHQRRSMLGDEMGLGKTVQALAVMAHLAARGEHRFLVVCPASVQVNWLNEIARHTRLTAVGLHGPDRDRRVADWLRHGGVGVTTFTTLAGLARAQSADLALLVVDEAHYVKNPGARRTEVVRAVAASAQRVLYLTGTPMENRVEEFRNLVEHLQPKVAALVRAGDAEAGARVFRRAVAPVYLRRDQVDVLTELPDRIEVEDWVLPTETDEAEYLMAVRAGNLMAMRQSAFQAPGAAKLERLQEIVEEAGEDRMKVVIFSHFLDVLSTARARLGHAVVGTVAGDVSPAARQDLVDRFTAVDGHAVLLCQIEAGGVGLNIQAASVVVITEPQWKPSTEDQAIVRAHRMGQVRRVQVHRLLAKGTVDERVREVQQHKSLLFDEYARRGVLTDGGAGSRPGGLDDQAIPTERRVILAEQHRLGVL